MEGETSDLADSVLECLACLEGWNLHSWDRNFLAWVAWVDAHASSALGNAECSEARDRHVVSFLKFLRDHTGHRFESGASCALRDARCVGNVSDEVLLGHRREENGVKRRVWHLV